MNKEENKQLTFDGGVTEQQVEQWKAKHRKVTRIDVLDGEELHVGYFKRPTMEIMAAVTKIAKTDEVKSSQTLFDGCWLGGSEEMRHDGVLFVATVAQLNQAFAQCMGSVKNL